MIKGFCRFQKLDKALAAFSKMKTLGIQPDEILYNSILDGCSKNGQADKAFAFYEMMQKEGVKPSTITFNSLIDACVRSGRMKESW
mmetsp:Transcript_29299/g.28463  ORF Transcript_29299/g.28463 Transcript_29299/m.28463 type:complete len:86 (+) Transcript_29299:1055-1312(+)